MNDEKKCAVFDLDGTLVNTLTDLQNACDILIKRHGYDAKWSESDYKQFVGNGIRKLIERAFRFSLNDEQLDEYLAEFLVIYDKIKLDNTAAYDGITEQLRLMKSKGIKLTVVTNKAESAAIGILSSIFGDNQFDVIIGQREGLPVKPDPSGVQIALQNMACTPEEALYFGDSNVDMQTAKNAGITAIGVTWGFRSREELINAGADKLIDSPQKISDLFLMNHIKY